MTAITGAIEMVKFGDGLVLPIDKLPHDLRRRYRYGESLRNRRLDAIARVIGSGAKMRLYTGALPNTCESADPLPEMLVGEIELGRSHSYPRLAAA
jgi:hypothetical protein